MEIVNWLKETKFLISFHVITPTRLFGKKLYSIYVNEGTAISVLPFLFHSGNIY